MLKENTQPIIIHSSRILPDKWRRDTVQLIWFVLLYITVVSCHGVQLFACNNYSDIIICLQLKTLVHTRFSAIL